MQLSKWRWWAGLLGTLFVVPWSTEAAVPVQVRVRWLRDQTSLTIQGEHLRLEPFQNLTDKSAQPVGLQTTSRSFRIERVLRQGKPLWHILELLTRQGQVLPPRHYFSGTPLLLLQGKHNRVGSWAAPDAIVLQAHRGKLDAIGLIPLEDYIMGVVAKEMPTQWSAEALKAQAVAARSYTMAILQERAHELVQMESSVLDQVFSPLSEAEVQTEALRKVRQAVQDTQGLQLLTGSGQPLKAFYHADCGGRTVSSASVFGIAGISGGVVDQSCPLHTQSHWQYHVRRQDLVHLMVDKGIWSSASDGTTAELQAVQDSQSKRVKELVLKTENGLVAKIRAEVLREWLGYRNIRSTLFHIEATSEGWILKGQGYGHGVGLCQRGAQDLAQHGADFIAILRHYYPQSQIQTGLQAREDLQSEKAHREQE